MAVLHVTVMSLDQKTTSVTSELVSASVASRQMDGSVTCAMLVTGDSPPASHADVIITPLSVTLKLGPVKNVSTIQQETTAKTVLKGFMVMPLRGH